MLRTVKRCLAASSLLLLAACGGGGGSPGGGVVAPPPPPPPVTVNPYVSNCATTPGALSCGTGAFYVDGPETSVRLDGTPTSYTFDSFQIDRKGTTQASDDVYLFSYFGGASVIYKFYTDLQNKNDGLGPVRTGKNVVRDLFSGEFKPGDGSTLTLFDITNVLQGGLDYVQLGQVSPNPINGAYTFFAVARTPSPTVMPSTGTARFDGGTRGAYISGAGTTYATASDVTLSANFATGAITGSTSNFKMVDANGATATQPHSLDYNFTANIAGSTFAGTASSTSMSGSVNGAFYGESGGAPAEAALAYTLGETTGGGKLVGVGGLKKN